METVLVYKSIKRPLPAIRPQESFDEFMKELVTRLVMEKSNNVIAYGYKTSAMESRSIFTTFHSSGNFILTHITSHNWSTIFSLLGPKKFLELLVNNKGFVSKVNGESVQIFGDVNSHRKAVVVSKYITKFNVLYNSYSRDFSRFEMIRPSIQTILQDILSFSGLNPGRSSKRYRGFKSLLSRIIANDKKCRYDILYAKFIGTSKCNFANVVSNKTEISQVIQFVLLVLGKLLPLDAWGGVSNKKIIKDRVVDFLLLGANEKIHMDDLFRGIRLKDFKWLGRAHQISSKQDFELRTAFLKGELELNYFPQYLWKELYESWVSKYAKNNLVKMPSKIQREQLPCGKIKLIPKRSSFRVICVPIKRSLKLLNKKLELDTLEKEKREFERYRKEVLSPVGQILRLKLSKLRDTYESYRASVHSSSDVAEKISDYRDSLLTRFGEIPKLFILKFDMKECYDRLSQPVLMKKLEELFENQDNKTSYYVRYYAQLDASHKLKKVKTTIDTQYHNLNILSSSRHLSNCKSLVDKTKTIALQKGNILEVCRSQIYDVVGSVKDARGNLHLYKRKRGVFQGFSLSSIFCDILYSAMVHDCFQFLWKSKQDFLFVRLVDDFLLVTPDSNIYDQVHNILSGKILESYGAFVNKDKTVVVNQTTTKQV
ncbi:Telomerase ribonucleoprotein complex - RNA binding domain family protein [Candida albicans]|uniref:Telomerase reverse transcriptase n=1 Tax=Candida albicans TaxID=5476 RepID=A0A8H6F125_CANAX|nr:Telomerase ribonucleoprotein complex - RNA binding domain family protein [Candida albicans]